MSKGKKPRSPKGDPLEIAPREPPPGPPVDPAPQCWDFFLSEATSEAKRSLPGQEVFGAVVGQLLGINTHKHLLGYAPADIAGEIIEAKKKVSGQLRGQIKDVTEAGVFIHLCLHASNGNP